MTENVLCNNIFILSRWSDLKVDLQAGFCSQEDLSGPGWRKNRDYCKFIWEIIKCDFYLWLPQGDDPLPLHGAGFTLMWSLPDNGTGCSVTAGVCQSWMFLCDVCSQRQWSQQFVMLCHYQLFELKSSISNQDVLTAICLQLRYHPALSQQPSAWSRQIHPWNLYEVFLFSSCLPAPSFNMSSV